MNKIAHGIVLVFFGVGCSLVWLLLQLPPMVRLQGVDLSQLPAFTRFCMQVGPVVLIALTLLATAYCIWVWRKRGEPKFSWASFLATATGSLFLVTLPVIVALYLPLVNAFNHLPR